MAISINVLTGNKSITDAKSYTTASITPTANSLVLLTVESRIASGTVGDPTITGNDITWVKVNSVQMGTGTNRRMIVFRGLVTSPSTGAITIDFGAVTQTQCIWSVAEFLGVDTTGTNGSGAIVQTGQINYNPAVNATSYSHAISAFSSANNWMYGVVGHQTNEATTVGDGFTIIHDNACSDNAQAMLTQCKLNDNTNAASWATSTQWAGIEIEIKAYAPTVATTVSAAGGKKRRKKVVVKVDLTPTKPNPFVVKKINNIATSYRKYHKLSGLNFSSMEQRDVIKVLREEGEYIEPKKKAGVMGNDRVKKLADIIYGENGGEDYDTMVMTGSSVLNREAANKPQEFGADLDEIGQKGYYAVSKNSPMYQQARTGRFPDAKSELAYKQAMQIAYGLEAGTIELSPAQFFFKKGEATSLRKKLKSLGKVGKYDTYSY